MEKKAYYKIINSVIQFREEVGFSELRFFIFCVETGRDGKWSGILCELFQCKISDLLDYLSTGLENYKSNPKIKSKKYLKVLMKAYRDMRKAYPNYIF